jgi:hypothetical protein
MQPAGFCAGVPSFTFIPNPKKAILRDMLRLFRKWLLVRRLRKALRKAKQGNGFVIREMRMRVVKGVFAQQTADCSPWIRIWGIRYEYDIHNLLDDLIADGYVDSITRENDGKLLLRQSSKGEAFCAPSEFLQEFLTRYDKAWTIVVVPAITFVAGIIATYLWPHLLRAFESAIAR